MDLKDITSNFLVLIAIIGFGVVAIGSGYQGMNSNPIIAGLGVVIIFADMILWYIQKIFSSRNKQKQ
jgi:hypothetical protein